MESVLPSIIFILLLVFGLFLLLVGTFLFFAPGILVKWNAYGNTWIGDSLSAKKHASSFKRRLFSADYTIFANHKTVGGMMWVVAIIFLLLYYFYQP